MINVEQYIPMIMQLALRCWRGLPPYARVATDPEDLLSGAIVQVLRKAHKFDPKKAKASTWVYRVTVNYLHDFWQHVTKPGKDASFTMHEELPARLLARPASHERRRGAELAVAAFLDAAPDELREALAAGFFNAQAVQCSEGLCEQARATRKRAPVTVEDFLICRAAHIAPRYA